MKYLSSIRVLICVILYFGTFSCNKNPKKESETNIVYTKDTIVKVKDSIDIITENNLSENIKKVITTKYLKDEDLKLLDSNDRKFSFQEIDINNDGKKEFFVSFFTPYFCGTGGCSLIMLDSDLNIINRFTVTETPIYIDPDFKNGWKVLFVKSKDRWKALEYEKGKYPSNPSVVKDNNTGPDPSATVIFKDNSSLKQYKF